MSNVREIKLPEVTIEIKYLDETLSSLLHTILFLRAPNIIKAKNVLCEELSPLIYAKCGAQDIDKIVSQTITVFKETISQRVTHSESNVNHATIDNHKGEVLLSFHNKSEVKEWGGLVSRVEQVCFERWRIVINIAADNSNSQTSNSDMFFRRYSTGNQPHYNNNSNDDDLLLKMYQYQQGKGSRDHTNEIVPTVVDHKYRLTYQKAYSNVSRTILSIIEAINLASDHVPLSMYDYEIEVFASDRADNPVGNRKIVHNNK